MEAGATLESRSLQEEPLKFSGSEGKWWEKGRGGREEVRRGRGGCDHLGGGGQVVVWWHKPLMII